MSATRDSNNIAPPGAILGKINAVYPLPPLNVHVGSSFLPNSFDIRWTSPSILHLNTCFNILGVNVYRAFNNYGPWIRLNTEPVGALFWRDNTKIKLALNEDVSCYFSSPDPSREYLFKTLRGPIHIDASTNDPNCTNLNVQVTVNNIPAFVEKISCNEQLIQIRHVNTYDVIGKKLIPAVVPSKPSDIVLATYKYVDNEVRTDLGQTVFYRITTVAVSESGQIIETPLNKATASNRHEVEKLDHIWTEAIRRSKWILDQGGERVKVFLRKSAGTKCGCYSGVRKQPDGSCVTCFGTGYIGGYDGPYDIIIAPDDAEKKFTQENRGRTFEHSYDTWSSKEPVLSQRDFMVKQNGDRYVFGPVRSPSARGMQLLQFFSVSHIDETDIRYKVPVLDTTQLVAPQTRYIVDGSGAATPMMTEKATIDDPREVSGKTATYENHRY